MSGRLIWSGCDRQMHNPKLFLPIFCPHLKSLQFYSRTSEDASFWRRRWQILLQNCPIWRFQRWHEEFVQSWLRCKESRGRDKSRTAQFSVLEQRKTNLFQLKKYHQALPCKSEFQELKSKVSKQQFGSHPKFYTQNPML